MGSPPEGAGPLQGPLGRRVGPPQVPWAHKAHRARRAHGPIGPIGPMRPIINFSDFLVFETPKWLSNFYKCWGTLCVPQESDFQNQIEYTFHYIIPVDVIITCPN